MTREIQRVSGGIRALDRNPAVVYLASLGSAGSRRTMLDALAVAVACFTSAPVAVGQERMGAVSGFDWSSLRYQHVELFRSVLVERGYSPATANKMLAAVRGVAEHARRLGAMPSDAAMAITRDVARVRGSRVAKGRALEPAEVSSLYAACDGRGIVGKRDRMLLSLLLYTGARREELARAEWSDVTPDGTLRIVGKGNKGRVVPIGTALAAELEQWKAALDDGIVSDSLHVPDTILCRASRRGTLLAGRELTGSGIFAVVRRIAARASLRSPIGPHDFRRTFVSTLIDRGVDLKTISHLVGHANVATTARYDRGAERRARSAVDMLAWNGGA